MKTFNRTMMKAMLLDGHKLARESWNEGHHIYLDGVTVKDENGEGWNDGNVCHYDFDLNENPMSQKDWYIVL